MFNLVKITDEGVRLGFYKKDNKQIFSPCYFLISNLGGGGTNVSRLISYLHFFEHGESQLLLNYYFLNNPSFDTDILEKLHERGGIVEFLKEVRESFIEKGRIIPNYKFVETNWDPEVMLDSGSGNIFRDFVKDKKLTVEKFEEFYTDVIKEYIEFGFKHEFDILIAMDIAAKYTEKKGEHKDAYYKKQLRRFKNLKINLRLLELTLENTKDGDIMVFAPIHGNEPKEFVNYLKRIFLLEKSIGKNFDGFAVGGLGRLRREDIYKICGLLRKYLNEVKDMRPIHVLGVGSLQNIIPLSLAGVDSFDCHSPWRRASEGKFVVPLVNSKGEIIANDDSYWDYVHIEDFLDKHFVCDCEVCSHYSLKHLKELFTKNHEFRYMAEILFFKHNISQQEFLCKLVRNRKISDFVKKIPDSTYKEKLLENRLMQTKLV